MVNFWIAGKIGIWKFSQWEKMVSPKGLKLEFQVQGVKKWYLLTRAVNMWKEGNRKIRYCLKDNFNWKKLPTVKKWYSGGSFMIFNDNSYQISCNVYLVCLSIWFSDERHFNIPRGELMSWKFDQLE